MRRYAGTSAPYPTTADFLRILKTHAEPRHHSLINDLFERITFDDLETRQADCLDLPNGRFRVTLEVIASKSYADGAGNLTLAGLERPIEIGVFGEKRVLRKKVPRQLSLERHQLASGPQTFEIEVESRPQRAGIDPYFKQIDQDPFDNVQELKCKPAPS